MTVETATAATPYSVSGPAPMHEAITLTGGGAVAHISLNGQIYALRITRAGKLILTK